MSSKKVKLFFGIVWLIAGLAKFLGLIAENFTGKEMITSSFQNFAKTCIVPFYTDIIITYFIPMAVLFIFLSALSEFFAGLFILRSRNLVKIGLALGIIMNILYAPLSGIPTIIVNFLFIVAQVWLWRKI